MFHGLVLTFCPKESVKHQHDHFLLQIIFVMGNSSLPVARVQCFDSNLSRNTVTPEFWEVHSISSDFSNNALGTAIVMLLLFLVGLPSNALVIVSIIKEQLYKEEATHILLLNLAISDFSVCLLVMPCVIVTGFAGEFVFGSSDYVRCQFCQFGTVFIALTVFSVNILATISMDRFIFIKYPLQYSKVVRIPVIIVIVIFLWLLSIFEALLPIIGFGQITFSFSLSACTPTVFGEGKYTMNIYYTVALICLALIPIVMIIVFNIWLACIVSKQIRVVYRTRRNFGNKEELKRYNHSLRKQMHKRRNRKQLVLVRVFGAILLSNIIVWMPVTIHIIVVLAVDPDQIPLGNYSFVYITFIMHSILHPLIEGWMIPEIKACFKSLLGVTFLRRQLKKLQEKIERRKSDAVSLNLIHDRDDENDRCCNCCDICTLAFALHSSEHLESQESPTFTIPSTQTSSDYIAMNDM